MPPAMRPNVQILTRRAFWKVVVGIKPNMRQRKGPPPKRDGPVFLASVSEDSALRAVLNSQSVNHETETDLIDGVTDVVDDVHRA